MIAGFPVGIALLYVSKRDPQVGGVAAQQVVAADPVSASRSSPLGRLNHGDMWEEPDDVECAEQQIIFVSQST